MKIAVYGGSFNPPHISHALVASWCLWTGLVDQVWMVPVFRHAFEDSHGKKLAPFKMRVMWCKSFSSDIHSGIIVSEVESLLPTPSYTVDTLLYLQDNFPEHHFRLLVGSDVLNQTQDWKQWDTIESRFDPIVVGRSGYENPDKTVAFPAISSTEIRTELAEGRIPKSHLTASLQRLLKESNPYAS